MRIFLRFLSIGYGVIRRTRKFGLVMALATGPALADEVVIAALGDSLTQGYGLVSDQGFVPQMQSWLNARGLDARLINAGVSGDTTAGGLARIDWTLTEEIDALIVALGGNDVLRGIDPAVSRSNLDGILSAASDRSLPVLLVGIAVPGNFGPDYQASFRAIYPELAEIHGTMLYTDFLSSITQEDTGTALATLLQGDGIHPNAEGVLRIVADMGPSIEALITAANR